jgi:hypothetical protein
LTLRTAIFVGVRVGVPTARIGALGAAAEVGVTVCGALVRAGVGSTIVGGADCGASAAVGVFPPTRITANASAITKTVNFTRF